MRRGALAAAAALLLVATGSAAAETATVTVVVKKTSVRRDRQFYAPTVVEAALGDSFSLLTREKGWVKVGTRSGEGWIHESAVTSKKVAVSAQGPAGSAADDRDIAAAGKGFNPQVESEYRKNNPEANYGAVDRMEKLVAGDKAVEAFVRDGNLEPRGAGK